MDFGTEIKLLPDDLGKTAEELGIFTDNNFEVSRKTLDEADKLALMQNPNIFFSCKTVENSEWFKKEINKAYDRGYRAAQRNSDDYKAGRNQGVSDVKQTISEFIKGTGSCRWLPILLHKLGFQLVEIKKVKS